MAAAAPHSGKTIIFRTTAKFPSGVYTYAKCSIYSVNVCGLTDPWYCGSEAMSELSETSEVTLVSTEVSGGRVQPAVNHVTMS